MVQKISKMGTVKLQNVDLTRFVKVYPILGSGAKIAFQIIFRCTQFSVGDAKKFTIRGEFFYDGFRLCRVQKASSS